MPITEYFTIWKMTVPSSWMAAALGLFTGWLVIRRTYGRRAADLAGDAIFTVLIVWKLSVFFTDFEVVRRSPAAILYFNGGTPGFIAGIALAAAWIGLSKKPLPPAAGRMVLVVAAVSQSGYQMVMALLNDGPAAARVLTVLLFALLGWGLLQTAAAKQVPVLYGALLFMAAHGFIAALQPSGFSGIPFAATAAACAAAVLADSLSQQRELEGLDE